MHLSGSCCQHQSCRVKIRWGEPYFIKCFVVDLSEDCILKPKQPSNFCLCFHAYQQFEISAKTSETTAGIRHKGWFSEFFPVKLSKYRTCQDTWKIFLFIPGKKRVNMQFFKLLLLGMASFLAVDSISMFKPIFTLFIYPSFCCIGTLAQWPTSLFGF